MTDCLMQSCFCFWVCDDGLLTLWPRSSLLSVGEAVKDIVRKEMAEIATIKSTNAVIRLVSLLLFLWWAPLPLVRIHCFDCIDFRL